jgi:hypothetical protein
MSDAIELAKQILDPTSCDELNYREFCADAVPELAQALLDCEARCEALAKTLRYCGGEVYTPMTEEEVMTMRKKIDETLALTSHPTPPTLNKDARIAELEELLERCLIMAADGKPLLADDIEAALAPPMSETATEE